MLISTIMVAALLLLVAVLIVADACRPMWLLHLRDGQPATGGPEQPASVSSPLEQITFLLSEEDRDGFFAIWQSIRQEFDLDPGATVLHADLLISDLIGDSVGPAAEEEWERAVLGETPLKRAFQSAHEIAVRSREGRARPFELRRAISLYTTLFEELLGRAETAG